jgi:hypothetical protein
MIIRMTDYFSRNTHETGDQMKFQLTIEPELEPVNQALDLSTDEIFQLTLAIEAFIKEGWLTKSLSCREHNPLSPNAPACVKKRHKIILAIQVAFELPSVTDELETITSQIADYVKENHHFTHVTCRQVSSFPIIPAKPPVELAVSKKSRKNSSLITTSTSPAVGAPQLGELEGINTMNHLNGVELLLWK